MILQAASDLDLDLPRSAIIGNSSSDIEAAAAAGIALRIRIGSSDAAATPDLPAHKVVSNLAEARTLLRSQLQSEP